MTCETILCEDEGAMGWRILDRPDDGKMFTPRSCPEVRDCTDQVRREACSRVLVKAGAPPLSCARSLFDGRTVSPVGELPSVPAFRGKACRFEHSRPGSAHGERRP